ncbi:MAG: acyl-CoA thioesterase [Nitrospiria bacterium]
MSRPEKKVSESVSEMVQIVLPNDTNMLGNLLGGTLMHWIDLAGATVANRHCRQAIVTASMEGLDFLSPIRLGHLVVLKGKMMYVGRSSMEVAVEVFSEDALTGERAHASSAILTYVAVDRSGKPVPVPKLSLVGNEENRLFQEAIERKRRRLSRLQKMPDGREGS